MTADTLEEALRPDCKNLFFDMFCSKVRNSALSAHGSPGHGKFSWLLPRMACRWH